ncbi:MAG: peptidase S8/S53 domain-containing protein [Podila humilis]|nr:MAG: peptidase S8/S53 domain-containing protein [Podila humilis]
MCLWYIVLSVPTLPNFAAYTQLEHRLSIPYPWVDQGPVPADQVLILRIGFKLPNLADFDRQVLESSTPCNYNYGNKIKLLLDPAKDAVNDVLRWFNTFGITATHDHQWLTLNLKWPKCHVYSNLTTKNAIIRALSYSVPNILVPFLNVVFPGASFDGNPSHPALPSTTAPPLKGADCNRQVTPACLQQLYGIPTEKASPRPDNVIAVAQFGEQFANHVDLDLFAATFHPDVNPRPKFTKNFVDGNKNIQDPAKTGVEVNLDIQYTAGLVVNVSNVFVSVGESLDILTSLVNYLIKQNPPLCVLSLSYAFDEYVMSSCPWVTAAVGATTGQIETAATLPAGTFSNYFHTADYQQNAVNSYLKQLGNTQDGLFNRSSRDFPDISAQGENIAIVLSGNITSIAGTAASTPLVASIVALLNDRLLAKMGLLGFLNPLIYTRPNIWNDVTTGTNPSCSTTGFPAMVGWDPVTGMGTPNFDKWAKALGV